MRSAILFLISVQFLAAETFTVAHNKTAWYDGKGTIQITGEGISYQANKPKHSRDWSWLDIQYFDRISETEFAILTYEDQRRYLGRDRSYRFLIEEGSLTDELFQTISEKLGRPVTNRVVRAPAAVRYEVPVKHLHAFGGCEGTLQFTGDAVYYLTGHANHAREWLLARDVDSVWSTNPYHLELHVYDNNRREFSRTRVYKFHLKQPMAPAFYRELKLALYKLGNNQLAER